MSESNEPKEQTYGAIVFSPPPEESRIKTLLKAKLTFFIFALVLIFVLATWIYGKPFLEFFGTCFVLGGSLAKKPLAYFASTCGIVGLMLILFNDHRRQLWEKKLLPFLKKYFALSVLALGAIGIICVAPFVQYEEKASQLHRTALLLDTVTNRVTRLQTTIDGQGPVIAYGVYSNEVAVANIFSNSSVYYHEKYINSITQPSHNTSPDAIAFALHNLGDAGDEYPIVNARAVLTRKENANEYKEQIQPAYQIWEYAVGALQQTIIHESPHCTNIVKGSLPDLDSLCFSLVEQFDVAGSVLSGDGFDVKFQADKFGRFVLYYNGGTATFGYNRDAKSLNVGVYIANDDYPIRTNRESVDRGQWVTNTDYMLSWMNYAITNTVEKTAAKKP